MGHRVVFRTWTYGMKQEALRKATKWVRDPGGGLQPDVDPWTLNDMMLLQTLVEWDLEDERGSRCQSPSRTSITWSRLSSWRR